MPSTTTYQKGELVLNAFPFSSGAKAQVRPAMIVLDTGDADLLVARVTTQPQQALFDVELSDWRGAGLLVASFVRLHKLATLEKPLVRRVLGRIQPTDRAAISAAIAQVFQGW